MRLFWTKRMNKRALVLFSGGQDSTVCLIWALQHFDYVETIGFDYGQRHAVELSCRDAVRKKITAAFPELKDKLGEDHLLDLNVLSSISETALTRDMEIAFQKNNLPNTFVPGRNLIFFNFAAALAYRKDIKHLVGGMCETDYSGYPDCRNETLQALEHAINLGMDEHFTLHTPLMHIDKAATWGMAKTLGGQALIDIIINDTHTCYKGERTTKHTWGYGCGVCPACELRARGYETFIQTPS
jgi:7-cyano-7-deazaguanine synthase